MIEALYAHSVTVCIIKLFYYSPLDICTHLNHLQRSYLISEENHTVALTLVLAYWSSIIVTIGTKYSMNLIFSVMQVYLNFFRLPL